MAILRLPGLIDPHVHLRDPGATHKEDFDTGTAAALAGGFTCVLDMPNNSPPTTDAGALADKRRRASSLARCDYGFHVGAGAANVGKVHELAPEATGLKLYLDQTFGPLKLEGMQPILEHAARWPEGSPILCHGEGRSLAAAILATHLLGRALHVCHVSSAEDIGLVRRAKDAGMRVTCEVAPHHLFLHRGMISKLGEGRSEVRPRLGILDDCAALRESLDIVDCFATDHAPHTVAEKDSAKPPPGFPGLETALPLYLRLVDEGLIDLDGLVARTSANARRIFGLPEQPETYVEIDVDRSWIARGEELHTRARWTPFEGWSLKGRVERVVLRGEVAFADGRPLAPPGSGQDVRRRQS
ncbi:MAG: amidohydrolase family protein [Deltaproteobacteria bacterium]|nr:amidohydrolase family protein [Deltaproteobacteria bacterium]